MTRNKHVLLVVQNVSEDEARTRCGDHCGLWLVTLQPSVFLVSRAHLPRESPSLPFREIMGIIFKGVWVEVC